LARLSLDGLDRFDDIHHQRFVLGMESAGKKPRRHCRAFTPEFKAEIVELCEGGTGASARSRGTST